MTIAIDPVCGEQVQTEEARRLRRFSDYHHQQPPDRPEKIDGTRYYFCSTACKLKFDVAPGFISTLKDGPSLHDQPETGRS